MAKQAPRPVIRSDQIKIVEGAPQFADRKSGSHRLDPVYHAILTMPPGSHFMVPGTEGRTGKQLMGTLSALSRWKKKTVPTDKRASGVTWGELKAGGVGVYKAKELAPGDPDAPGSGSVHAPRATPITTTPGRPAVRLRSEDM